MTANPWKVTSLLLAAALGASLLGQLPAAEAAGPVRLGKALAALKSGKKFLEEARDPPAPQHAQSLAAVTQAIAAVEREIKAYEAASARAKAAGSAPASARPAPAPAPPRKKEEKAGGEKIKKSAEVGED